MNKIIIDVGTYEDRVAVLEADELIEVFHEKKDENKVQGNVYKGRVVNVLKGMQAAFVDIGLSKNAFLYIKDALPKEQYINGVDYKNLSINDLVKQGDELIVQVIKEPYDSKGPRVTTHISLPGRYLVLMPYNTYVGVSRKINKENERQRLKDLANELKPEDMGLILRTASIDKSVDELKIDINYLVDLYSKIMAEENVGSSPRLIYKDLDLPKRTIRDIFTKKIDEVLINNKEKYDEILKLVKVISPNLKDRINYLEDSDLFSELSINLQIESAIEKKVWLQSGGYLVIDETEALTSIDVNTGKFVGSIDLKDTVFKTNIEAAKEIAKQLRLRNIGGIIIIDFIDMFNSGEEDELIELLKRELKKDRIKTTVIGMTGLGLVEMTRKKSRNKLSTQVLSTCKCCKGTGKIKSTGFLLTKIEKEVKRVKNHTSSSAVLFELNSYKFEDIIKNHEKAINSIEENNDIKIFFKENNDLNIDEIKNKKMGRVKDLIDKGINI
ncbi:Rne/Rng family ribonuclease [Senegalia sp. (in: firmicutes)]|uniref:Rne/Rng family ribonuclease n=1 Tax=Senegalia sp. (in: firmicutes) TaxID=1924098 RepID=UPI003F94D945